PTRTPAATAAGRATFRWCGSTSRASAGWAGPAPCRRARRCGARSSSSTRRPRVGSSDVAARRAAFLDRDGVLNAAERRGGRPHPPARLADMRLLPGVAEACARLKAAGFLLIVVTNQPDIARGRADAGDVAAINAALKEQLGLDEICVCPHDDADGCD